MNKHFIFFLFAASALLTIGCKEYTLDPRCVVGTKQCIESEQACYTCEIGTYWAKEICSYGFDTDENGNSKCKIIDEPAGPYDDECQDDEECQNEVGCLTHEECQEDVGPNYFCNRFKHECTQKCKDDNSCEDGFRCREDGRCASEDFTTVWRPELRKRLYTQNIPMKIITSNQDCSDLQICWDWKENEENTFEPVTEEECLDEEIITEDGTKNYKVITKLYPQVENLDEDPDAGTELIIKIQGKLNGFRVYGFTPDDSDRANYAPDLLEVRSFGTVSLAEDAFRGCTNLKSVSSIDVPDMTNLKSTSSMFRDCQSFNSALGEWDVSNVKNMSYMFANATSFNQKLKFWDVSNVKDMSNMFNGASKLDQDLSEWEFNAISSLDKLENMFRDTKMRNSYACNIIDIWTLTFDSFFGIEDAESVFGKEIDCDLYF